MYMYIYIICIDIICIHLFTYTNKFEGLDTNLKEDYILGG